MGTEVYPRVPALEHLFPPLREKSCADSCFALLPWYLDGKLDSQICYQHAVDPGIKEIYTPRPLYILTQVSTPLLSSFALRGSVESNNYYLGC